MKHAGKTSNQPALQIMIVSVVSHKSCPRKSTAALLERENVLCHILHIVVAQLALRLQHVAHDFGQFQEGFEVEGGILLQLLLPPAQAVKQ